MMDKIYIQVGSQKTEAKDKDLAYIIEAQKDLQSQLDKKESELADKTSSRQSALAKLAALGLTEQEIAAL
jgi:DNA-binding NarL/FixJ family response regulator